MHATQPSPPAAPRASQQELNDQLIYRVYFGRADDVRILLERGADPNSIGNDGEPAIVVATRRGDEEAYAMVRHLIAFGAQYDSLEPVDRNPIIVATKTGNARIVEALFAEGVSHLKTDSEGRSLLELARLYGHEDIQTLVSARIEADKERQARLRGQENLTRLVQLFTIGHCSKLYLEYNADMAASFGPHEDTLSDRLPETLAAIEEGAAGLQQYYGISAEELTRVADRSQGMVFQELERLVSPQNRIKHGVGTAEDLERRCEKVGASWYVRIAPGTEYGADPENPQAFPQIEIQEGNEDQERVPLPSAPIDWK